MKKWKCTVCGYIHTGETPPDECPMCAADKSKFVELVDEETVSAASQDKATADTTGVGAKETPFDKVAELVLKNHLHPITVHTPNGIVPAAVIFLLIGLVLRLTGFERAAFYNLVFVLVTFPPVLVTGYIEWQKRYKGARTGVFYTKVFCGVVVMAVLACLVVWRIIDPQVAAPESASRWVYFLVHLILLAAVGLAGHLGGKLAFAGRNR